MHFVFFSFPAQLLGYIYSAVHLLEGIKHLLEYRIEAYTETKERNVCIYEILRIGIAFGRSSSFPRTSFPLYK